MIGVIGLTDGTRKERMMRGEGVRGTCKRGREGSVGKVGSIAIYINIGPRSIDYINMMTFRYAYVFFSSSAAHRRSRQKYIDNKNLQTLIVYTYYLTSSYVSSSFRIVDPIVSSRMQKYFLSYIFYLMI